MAQVQNDENARSSAQRGARSTRRANEIGHVIHVEAAAVSGKLFGCCPGRKSEYCLADELLSFLEILKNFCRGNSYFCVYWPPIKLDRFNRIDVGLVVMLAKVDRGTI